MYGVKSSYYDFNKTLGKHSQIRFYQENYLKADDLWADFEGALAKINVEAMCSPVTIDMFWIQWERMKSNIQLKYSNYVVFCHLLGYVMNHSGLSILFSLTDSL